MSRAAPSSALLSALRLRLRVQARADPGASDRHKGRVCRAAEPSEDLRP